MAPSDHLVHCCWTAWIASLDRGRVLYCVQACEPMVRPTDVVGTGYHFDAVRHDILPYI